MEHGRGGDGPRRRRTSRRCRPRLRLAARQAAAARRLVRVLRRRRGRRPHAATPTSPPTSRSASGTTTSSTGDDAFLRRMWPVVERAIDHVLEQQAPTRCDRLARRRPRRRRAADRLVEHPHEPALRHRHRRAPAAGAPGLGARRSDLLATAIAHRPGRLPGQVPLGDGLVLPDPRRRPARGRGARAHRRRLGHVRRRGPRRALRVGPTVDHRRRDVRAGHGPRRDRRGPTGARPASAGRSSCGTTTARTGAA